MNEKKTIYMVGQNVSTDST